jgi:hypothetical protein
MGYDNLYSTIYFVYIHSIRKMVRYADMRFNNRIQYFQPFDKPIKAVAKFNDLTQEKRAVKFAIPKSTTILEQNEYLPKNLPKALTTITNIAVIFASKSNTIIQTATPFSEKEEDFYDAEEHSEFLIDSPTDEKQNLLDFKGSIAANQPAKKLTPLRNQIPDSDKVCELIDSIDSEPSNDAEDEPSQKLAKQSTKDEPKNFYNIRKLTRAAHGISFLYLN